jgi:hypothetical protein
MKEDYYEMPQEATYVGEFSDTPEKDHGMLFPGVHKFWAPHRPGY